MKLVFLKLGGSAITDKTRPATPRPDIITAAAGAIRETLNQERDMRLVLGHGSGSFGHYAARQWGFGQPGNWRAFAETGAAAGRLNRLVTDLLLAADVPALSLQPSASALCRDGELVNLALEPITTALAHGLVPLVYGDVAFDATRGMTIASTDMLFAFLARHLSPARIVYATAVNGVYTADPFTHLDAERIREITPASFAELRATVGGSHGIDVTGGMLDKLARSVQLVEQMSSLEILITGVKPNVIRHALLDAQYSGGTRIHAG